MVAGHFNAAFISFWILMSVAAEIESWATLPQKKSKKYFMAFPHKAKERRSFSKDHFYFQAPMSA